VPISEDQLERWSHQGQTRQFTSTYQTLKALLDATQAPYVARSCDTFLQGSYANDTNVHADSDVDIVLRTRAVYYSDTENLTPDDKASFEKGWSRASYQIEDFKNDAIAWLKQHYGGEVRIGSKAITIDGSGTRRDADVIVAAEFRRYRTFRNDYDQSYEEGICFFLANGRLIQNFPSQHSSNCTTKHQSTNRWFKPTVRVFKNLRNKMIREGLLAAGAAPSYFLEGLLYNVPSDRFGGTHTANFIDVLSWIVAADRSKFLCANEQFYLLNDFSPVTWTEAKCDAFINAAVACWTG
jgi:predicted nucleotidyltransferase